MEGDIEVARRYLASLQVSERLPAADLQAYQQGLMQKLVMHAVASTPYYRETIGARMRDLDLSRREDWHTLPTTDRAVLAARAADLRSSAVPENHGELRPVRSGGSTGNPIEILLSDLESTARVVATYRMFEAYHFDPGLPLMMIRHPQFGSGRRDRLTFRKWSYPWLNEAVLGDRIHVDITTPVADQLLKVEAHAPLYLNTLPSNLLRLAMEAQAQKKKISIPIIISVAEYLPPEVRRLAEEVFDARVVDVLSSSEAGVIAVQCPLSGQHHVQSELVVAEVLDADGRPCAAGEAGELVVTPLYNYASPVIRYRSGDFVVPGVPCACGRTLPTLQAVIGRQEHLFLYPDGSRARPPIDHVRISSMLGHDLWQLEQVSLRQLTFKYAAPKPIAVGEGELRAAISTMMGDTFEVRAERHASMPLTSGGKRSYVKSLTPAH